MSVTLTGMDYIRPYFGLTTQPRDVALAVHEAGHAVTALALGAEVDKVTITAGKDDVGHCLAMLGAQVDEAAFHARELRFYLAGEMAVESLLDSAIMWESKRVFSAHADEKNAAAALDAMGLTTRAERQAAIDQARREVRSIFATYGSDIDYLAGALLKNKTIAGMANMRKFCPKASRNVSALAAVNQRVAAPVKPAPRRYAHEIAVLEQLIQERRAAAAEPAWKRHRHGGQHRYETA